MNFTNKNSAKKAACELRFSNDYSSKKYLPSLDQTASFGLAKALRGDENNNVCGPYFDPGNISSQPAK